MTVIRRKPRENIQAFAKNRGNSDWLEIPSCVLTIRLLRSVSAFQSARWQSHDNQRRIVIGNPISLPNCTPNRFAGTNGNFLHVPCVIYFHVPELNTRDRASVATLSASCAICASSDAYPRCRLLAFNI